VDDRQWTIARDYEGSGRHAKAEHLQKEAEKRYGVALALVQKENAKSRLTKSVAEALRRGD
jgi:hypothetical protein